MNRALLLLGCACGPTIAVDGSTIATTSTGALETSTTDATTTSADVSTSSDASTSTTSSTTRSSEETDGCPFICPDDVPTGTTFECDQWAQDCPPGQKCMPWANDGGNVWNALRCAPIADDPRAVGESCTVEGSGVSGIDDCELRAMCWDVDPETNEGTCSAMCIGSEAYPVCLDPTTQCSINGDGVITLCFPSCDPLLQDCDDGEGCYPVNAGFACTADASQGRMGSYGGSCEFTNACAAGLFCDDLGGVPDCAGSQGCCNRFCDLSVADPDATCPDAAQGQTCVAWFQPGQAPPGLQYAGRCAVTP